MFESMTPTPPHQAWQIAQKEKDRITNLIGSYQLQSWVSSGRSGGTVWELALLDDAGEGEESE